jgi:Asp-tRNA(Asn)/Glu-tRNA(Gln) amidotransferase A subunit family amidase
MIAAKEVKPSEIMAVVLARIEKLNPRLNAFCTITQDSFAHYPGSWLKILVVG